jgi:hypothetical protein
MAFTLKHCRSEATSRSSYRSSVQLARFSMMSRISRFSTSSMKDLELFQNVRFIDAARNSLTQAKDSAAALLKS